MPTTPVDKQAELAASYGWALSVLRSNPELSKLFDSAVKDTYSSAMFVAKLRNTSWYKTRSESVRQNAVLKSADPAEYNRRLQQKAGSIADAYFQMTGRNMSAAQAKQLGTTAFTFNFNDGEIRDLVSGSVKTQTLMQYGLGGTLGDAEKQLRQAAEDYGLDFSDAGFASQLNNVASQRTDVGALVDNYRKQAKSRYAAFADELDQGLTVRDIAEPYKQLMAKTLEVSDKGLSVMDPNIQKALTYRAPAKGGKPGAPTGMQMWQFESDLKNDPRWVKTQNAQDSIMSAGKKVLSDMGLLGATG